ncbi:Xaa-Pro dipeptidase, partial [Blautia hominis]|nr:Xaa-Pro dipeptidase [Blautia hominis]
MRDEDVNGVGETERAEEMFVERQRMFGECHANVFMDGVNYKEAVKRHLNGVVEGVNRRHF